MTDKYKVIEALEKEQCDVKDALTRCMDMEDLYVELLGLFADDPHSGSIMWRTYFSILTRSKAYTRIWG